MNIKDKITINLNRSEIEALIVMFAAFNFEEIEKRTALMAVYIAKKLFQRLIHRTDTIQPGKEIKFKMKVAEGVAMVTILNGTDPRLAWDTYNTNLIMKIQSIVNQKLA